MRTWTMLGVSLLAPLAMVRCGGGAVPGDAGNGTDSGSGDSGVAKDAGPDSAANDSGVAPDSGPADSGSMGDVPFLLNGCGDGDFIDRSAQNDSRTITWDFNVSPRCILVGTGQTVTWQGTFATHPLASFGGDANSPIQTTTSGTSAAFPFAAQGNFGFHCNVHGSMQGVVRVKP